MDKRNEILEKYGDIIDLPHHESREHPRMSLYARAAQFAPFAALNGHGAAIMETARLTDKPIELSDLERSILDQQFNKLLSQIADKPHVIITHFVHDPFKEGGQYVTTDGVASKWDELEKTLILDDGTKIPVLSIINIHLTK